MKDIFPREAWLEFFFKLNYFYSENANSAEKSELQIKIFVWLKQLNHTVGRVLLRSVDLIYLT